MREISYAQAVSEATIMAMREDPCIYVMGCGVSDAKGIFNTTLEATQNFGKTRVIDTPLSENTILGAAMGASLGGMHALIVHARVDFLMLCMDQLVNNIAKWCYMTGGRNPVGVTIRAIIGRGWGQAAQHSQSLQALFCHIPGLNVIMPSQPSDAKGLLTTALLNKTPTLCIEHRWLHAKTGSVQEGLFEIPFGVGKIMRPGIHLTIVAISQMVWEAMEAAKILAEDGIEVEIIDPRTLAPLDEGLILNSVLKTGRLLVADTAWPRCGMASEIISLVTERIFSHLKTAPQKITLPDYPTPCSPTLEKAYYPTSTHIVQKVREMLTGQKCHAELLVPHDKTSKQFQGPF